MVLSSGYLLVASFLLFWRALPGQACPRCCKLQCYLKQLNQLVTKNSKNILRHLYINRRPNQENCKGSLQVITRRHCETLHLNSRSAVHSDQTFVNCPPQPTTQASLSKPKSMFSIRSISTITLLLLLYISKVLQFEQHSECEHQQSSTNGIEEIMDEQNCNQS